MSDRVKRYGLFGVLYLASATAGALILSTLLLRLYDGGITQSRGGEFLAIVGIPWVAKPVFGLAIDRFGRKSRWVAGCALAMAVAIACLPFAGNSYTPVLALALFANLARAFQDVATDGWAIEVLARNERGQSQTVMWTCAKLGEVLGAGGFIYLLAKRAISWPAACGSVAVLVVLAGVLALVANVRPVNEESAPPSGRRGFLRSFLGAASLMGLGIAILANAAPGMMKPIIFPWWRSLRYAETYTAFLLTCNAWAEIGGVLLAGVASRYMSRLRVFGIAVVIVAGSYAAIGLLSLVWGSKAVVFAMVMATAVADGFFSVAVCTLMMDLSDRGRYTATRFAVYMAFLNFSTSWANWAGGHLSGPFGIAGTFLAGAACQLLVFLPLALLIRLRRKSENK